MAKKIIILGKPNVGKSSLFNRLLRDKIAITSEIEGTTRDINIRPLNLGEAENPLYVELCDTAGLTKKANGIFKNVKKMIFDFIDEGDLILYVVSAEDGILEEDLRFFRSLKNATLVVNKTDIEKNERWEYNAFGAERIFYISSLHNRGIKQLKDFLTLWVGNSSLQETSLHSFWATSLALGENFGKQQTPSLVLSQNFSPNTKSPPQILEFWDLNQGNSSDSNESKNFPSLATDTPPQTPPARGGAFSLSPSLAEGIRGWVKTHSLLDSAQSAESVKNQSCEAQPKEALSGAGVGVVREGEGSDFAIQAPTPSLKENARGQRWDSNADLSAERRKAINTSESLKSHFLDSSPTAQNDNTINIGIIGRVNVGKSSILNALLGKERSLVSEIEGTTIDPVSDEIIYKDKILRFVDTAGIRRASKIEGIEKFALTRTKRILEQSNIVLLVLDSSRDFVELDEKISGLSQKYNLGIIILLNKWDIKCADFRAFSESIKRKFAYLSYAPILTISALKMRHIDEIKATILRVWENFNRRIPTALLNTHIKIATQRHPLPSDRGKIVKIYYASQVDCAPPQILLVMNRPRALHFSYKRYLVNYFRANFDFSGVPIVILSKGRGKDEVAE